VGLPGHILEKTTVSRKKGVEIWGVDNNEEEKKNNAF
jgi:hypothetical protein